MARGSHSPPPPPPLCSMRKSFFPAFGLVTCGLRLFSGFVGRQLDLYRVDLDFFSGFQAFWTCDMWYDNLTRWTFLGVC